jgi:hypothetical protein
MGYSQYDPANQGRAAWNAGKTVGTKRPFTQKQIWAIRFFLDREGRVRDRSLRWQSTASYAAVTWSKSRLATWSLGRKYA